MYFKAGKPVSEYTANVVAAPYRLSTEWRYAPPRNMRRYLRGKYDVSGLPPMPTHLMPLVMPQHYKSQNATTEAIPTSELAIARELWQTQTQTKVCEEDESSDDERCVIKRVKTIKKMMNWADMCDSDVEDDEF